MEDIKRTIGLIVARCESAGIADVSPTLAAVVTRSVVLENPEQFRLDKAMQEADVTALVEASVARLQDSKSPQLMVSKYNRRY